MAFERTWAAVAPQPLITDGNQFGLVTIADTAGFKVKQSIVLSNPSLGDLAAQVKRVLSPTKMIVGRIDNKIANWLPLDISAYTVALGSAVAAGEQPKNKISAEDIVQASYEGDPAVAIRTVFVDKYGNFYDGGNPLPIAFDGTVNIGRVRITAKNSDSSPDTVHSSVRLGGSDGTSEANIHSDGSVDIRQVNKLITVPHDTIQVTASSPAGDPTTILFKSGGLSGTIEATLTIAYDSSGNFQSVVKS